MYNDNFHVMLFQIKEEMEQLRMKGLQQEEENQLALKRVKDLQQECEIQVQQYEAQAEDISKTLDQIKTGDYLIYDNLIILEEHYLHETSHYIAIVIQVKAK